MSTYRKIITTPRVGHPYFSLLNSLGPKYQLQRTKSFSDILIRKTPVRQTLDKPVQKRHLISRETATRSAIVDARPPCIVRMIINVHHFAPTYPNIARQRSIRVFFLAKPRSPKESREADIYPLGEKGAKFEPPQKA